MNILVFDDPPTVGRLVRSALAGRRIRVSLAATDDEARAKLETGLFDALVIGAGGASAELSEYLETEWPHLPLILAGVERAIPCAGPIVAVIPRPVRLDAIRGAALSIESRGAAALPEVDAELLVAAGVRVPGRVVARGRASLLFEPASGVDFDASGSVTVLCGGAETAVDLLFTDPAPRGGARRVALHVGDPAAFERFASIQPGGVAC